MVLLSLVIEWCHHVRVNVCFGLFLSRILISLHPFAIVSLAFDLWLLMLSLKSSHSVVGIDAAWLFDLRPLSLMPLVEVWLGSRLSHSLLLLVQILLSQTDRSWATIDIKGWRNVVKRIIIIIEVPLFITSPLYCRLLIFVVFLAVERVQLGEFVD